MMTNEPVIHLKDGEKFLCDVKTDQDELDAINALIHWLDGFSSGTSKAVPGHYELSMVYKRLRASHIAKHANKRKSSR